MVGVNVLMAALVLLFAFLMSPASAQSRCQITTSTGRLYDFNSAFSQDITSNNAFNNDGCTYTLNLCGTTSSTCGAGVLACQQCGTGSIVRPLAYSSSLALSFVNASTPQLGIVAQAQQFNTLNPCYRNVNVIFACGPDTSTFTQIESVTNGNTCLHNFVVPSTLLCQFNKQ